MREIAKLGAKLLLISAVAGLLLGATNAVTAGPIQAQSVAAANAARQSVLPSAASFERAAEIPEGIDEIHLGYDASGALAGCTGSITVQGYGGPIEITVGVGIDGAVAGVSVGGSNFQETAGLGAKTKDAAFTDRFRGLDSKAADSIAVVQDGGAIDAVSAATVSSRAVANGVRQVCAALQEYLAEGN